MIPLDNLPRDIKQYLEQKYQNWAVVAKALICPHTDLMSTELSAMIRPMFGGTDFDFREAVTWLLLVVYQSLQLLRFFHMTPEDVIGAKIRVCYSY